jgi:Rrf2 family protein
MSATNVQFSVGVHMMTALGFHHPNPLTSRILAQSVNADSGFVRRSLSKLVKAGLVRTTMGKNGSCTLARAPEKINLLAIYRATEAPPTFAIHSYPEERTCPTSSHIKPTMEQLLNGVQTTFERKLAKSTLAAMVAEVKQRSGC